MSNELGFPRIVENFKVKKKKKKKLVFASEVVNDEDLASENNDKRAYITDARGRPTHPYPTKGSNEGLLVRSGCFPTDDNTSKLYRAVHTRYNTHLIQ